MSETVSDRAPDVVVDDDPDRSSREVATRSKEGLGS